MATGYVCAASYREGATMKSEATTTHEFIPGEHYPLVCRFVTSERFDKQICGLPASADVHTRATTTAAQYDDDARCPDCDHFYEQTNFSDDFYPQWKDICNEQDGSGNSYCHCKNPFHKKREVVPPAKAEQPDKGMDHLG